MYRYLHIFKLIPILFPKKREEHSNEYHEMKTIPLQLAFRCYKERLYMLTKNSRVQINKNMYVKIVKIFLFISLNIIYFLDKKLENQFLITHIFSKCLQIIPENNIMYLGNETYHANRC